MCKRCPPRWEARAVKRPIRGVRICGLKAVRPTEQWFLRAVCAACILFIVILPAEAFILPSDPTVGAGSEWVYDSNLGVTRVRMLERLDTGPDFERYVWDMRVAGLRYQESIELVSDRLGVTRRRLTGFGLVREEFRFAVPELVLKLPLQVGNEWTWRGDVNVDGREGEETVSGKVLAKETVSVPAGRFETYHIHLDRQDNLGTVQAIDLWFDPDIGPIRAVGDLRWRGLVGFVQRLVGLDRFTVELRRYTIEPVKEVPVHRAKR